MFGPPRRVLGPSLASCLVRDWHLFAVTRRAFVTASDPCDTALIRGKWLMLLYVLRSLDYHSIKRSTPSLVQTDESALIDFAHDPLAKQEREERLDREQNETYVYPRLGRSYNCIGRNRRSTWTPTQERPPSTT